MEENLNLIRMKINLKMRLVFMLTITTFLDLTLSQKMMGIALYLT